MTASTPKPGSPVRGSETGRPIMALLDLLGRRWTLRIIFELRNGPYRFRALQEKCDQVSPTMLNTRIKELREAGVVEMSSQGYQLSELGRELWQSLEPLRAWAERWAASLAY